MAIKKNHLTELGVRDSDADKYLSNLNQLMNQYQIGTELRMTLVAAARNQLGHITVRIIQITEDARFRRAWIRRGNAPSTRQPDRNELGSRHGSCFRPARGGIPFHLLTPSDALGCDRHACG